VTASAVDYLHHSNTPSFSGHFPLKPGSAICPPLFSVSSHFYPEHPYSTTRNSYPRASSNCTLPADITAVPRVLEFWIFVFSVSLLDTVGWWVTGRTSGL